MRRFVISFVLIAFLFVMIVGVSGCCMPAVSKGDCSQMGETAAEGRRRQVRNSRINQQQLNSDIENFMMYDEPSKLNELRIK